MATPSAPFDRVYNDIKISVPGAIDAVIQQELYRTASDFFDQTNAWTEDIPFNVTPNTLTYTVTPLGKGSINRLMLVYDPAMASPDKRWVQGSIEFIMPDTIQLHVSPSTGTTWHAIVAKQLDEPTSTENYPDIDTSFYWVISKYRDAFVYGTLGRLFMQPSKPYSNAQLARYNSQNYISERSQARGEILHSQVYNGQRWQFPQAYATTARKGWT
jgi:hypothetical protein